MTAAADPPFRQLGIAGVGLIGGSIACAARRAWPGITIVGVDRPDVTREAAARGLVDAVGASVRDLGDVDLVILAAPVPAILDLLGDLAAARPAALITDTGSTKRDIVAAARRLGLTRFIGGHPMAGAERGGLAQAVETLFDDRPWLLTTDGAAAPDVDRLTAFARGLRARPQTLDATQHDRLVAFVSHLPQLLAVSLLGTVGKTLGAGAIDIAGPAFRDMTRIAGSPAELWRGIVSTNADFIDEALRALEVALPKRTSELRDGSWIDAAFPAAQAWCKPAPSSS